MRTVDHKELKMVTEPELDWVPPASAPVSHRSYHELAETPVVELDALAQLEANVQILEGLHGRLTFMMREVRELMKI